MSQKKSPKTQNIQKSWRLLKPKNYSARTQRVWVIIPPLNCSLVPYGLLGFHHLPKIVYCPHSIQHDPINYKTECVISAANLLQPFISLTVLWPWRLHILGPPANLFDFIVCLTSLLKVHSVHPDLHLANAKHVFSHLLYLWSSSQSYLLDSPTSVRFLLECSFIYSYIFIIPRPAYTKSCFLHHSSASHYVSLVFFTVFVITGHIT